MQHQQLIRATHLLGLPIFVEKLSAMHCHFNISQMKLVTGLLSWKRVKPSELAVCNSAS
jgi:hypothetical protein